MEAHKAAEIIFNREFPNLISALLGFLMSDKKFRDEVTSEQIGEIVKALSDKAGGTEQRLTEALKKMAKNLKELKGEASSSQKTTQQKVDKIKDQRVTLKEVITSILKASVYSVSNQLGTSEEISINSIANSLEKILSNLNPFNLFNSQQN